MRDYLKALILLLEEKQLAESIVCIREAHLDTKNKLQL